MRRAIDAVRCALLWVGTTSAGLPTAPSSFRTLTSSERETSWPMSDESARHPHVEASAGAHRRLTAILIVLAVVLANAAFIGLGSVFEYPDILQQPTDEILTKFRAEEATIVVLFSMLALASALLAPIALLLGRLADNNLGRWSIRVGVAAAVVQVIGLLRWPLVVPFLADRDATDGFEAVHTVLGKVVGETFGYLLTATWTVLIIYALGERLAGRWFKFLGLAAAAMIAVGVLVPLGVPGTDFANFLGYIVWSVWLLAFATLIWRRRTELTDSSAALVKRPAPAGSAGG